MAGSMVDDILSDVLSRCPNEPQFHQAVREVAVAVVPVLESHPEYVRARVFQRVAEPDRQILFRVTWVDDAGEVRVNRGYRVQFSNLLGPYKGGLRFHPSVDLSIIKFLGFEQVFKNALTGLPIGGAKGGSDFDPKGRSDLEVMRFCQSFMAELYRHIGPDVDVPAGDIGVGGREVGYLYGAYRKYTNSFSGAISGKGVGWGGSLVRTQATGYGLVYFATRMLSAARTDWKGKDVVVSGSGNVACFAAEKVVRLGGRVIGMSDSEGFIHEPAGMDVERVKQVTGIGRGYIREYADGRPGATYTPGSPGLWRVPCSIAMPCATQNELDLESARALISNGCKLLAEGANMPCTPDAIAALRSSGVAFAPAKAANAGGVATSVLEMAQNSSRQYWTFDEVDNKLHAIMNSIYSQCEMAARDYGDPGNLVLGANAAGFVKVAQAVLSQGVL